MTLAVTRQPIGSAKTKIRLIRRRGGYERTKGNVQRRGSKRKARGGGPRSTGLYWVPDVRAETPWTAASDWIFEPKPAALESGCEAEFPASASGSAVEHSSVPAGTVAAPPLRSPEESTVGGQSSYLGVTEIECGTLELTSGTAPAGETLLVDSPASLSWGVADQTSNEP